MRKLIVLVVALIILNSGIAYSFGFEDIREMFGFGESIKTVSAGSVPEFIKEPLNSEKFNYLKVYPELSRLNCPNGDCYVVWELCNLNQLDQDKKDLSYFITDAETQTLDKSNFVNGNSYEILKEEKINQIPYEYDCFNDNVTKEQTCKTGYENKVEYVWEDSTAEDILNQAQNKCVKIKQNVDLQKQTLKQDYVKPIIVDLIPKLYDYTYSEFITLSSSKIKYRWEFNESSGTNTMDAVNYKNLTLTSMVWDNKTVQNLAPYSLTWNADNDQYTSTVTGGNFFASKDWCISLWVNTSQAMDYPGLFFYIDEGVNNDKDRIWGLLGWDGGDQGFRVISNSGSIQALKVKNTLNNGSLHNLLLSQIQNSDISVYYDGVLNTTLAYSGDMVGTNWCINQGTIYDCSAANTDMRGSIDQLIYIEDYNCTVEDALDLYNGGLGLGEGSDECTAPVSGNWSLSCANNCTWSSAQDIPGNILITDSGLMTLSANLTFTGTNQIINISSGCTLNITAGGGFN